MRLAAPLLSLAVLAAAPAFAGTRAWTIDDMLSTRTVSNPQISPDGKWVVYVVSALTEDKSDYQTDLWLVPTEGGKAQRLTTSLQADESPQWSPDGAAIAFLSERPRPGAPKSEGGAAVEDEGKRQIWLIRPFGGEASLLSSAKGGVSEFEWSRDGRKVAYLSKEPKSDERRKKEKEKDDAWTPKEKYSWNRLWVMDVESRKSTQLTSGEFHVSGFSFAPDGRLAVAGQPTPLIPDNYHSDIYVIPAAGGKPTPVVQRKGLDNQPRWSPDGKWIAFTSQSMNTPWYSNLDICVVPASGGTVRDLTASFDERANDATWTSDSRALLFQSVQRTAAHGFRVSLDGSPIHRITSGAEMNSSFSCDDQGRSIAFLRQDAERPNEVHVQRLEGGPARSLTNTNPQVDELLSFKKQLITWKGPDGRDIDGLVVYPPGYRKGQRVPLLLNVHGGPAGTHSNSWTPASRTYAFPLFAQKGYAILFPNPRGSGGYGGEFRAANVRDWGGKDYEDIMAGVDHLIATGVADPARMAVCGWSYGGFMTSNIITRTDRFKAAAVGAGVTDLFSMALTTDIPDFNRDYFDAWPWDNPALYAERSAVVHANNVKTPTLVVHGEKDDRVPTSQGWELYTALRKVGVPTDLLLIPRAPHGPREPKLLRSIEEWHLDWINRYTLGTAAAPKTVLRPKPSEKMMGADTR